MKLNFKVFKKGKAIYWIVAALVLFGFFYWFANRGSNGSSGGGTTYVNSGPSDASVAASTALAARQGDNSAQVAIATLQYQGGLAQIQAQADVAKYVKSLDSATQSKYLDTQLGLAALDGEYNIATARIAAQSQYDTIAFQTAQFHDQLTTNQAMFHDQMVASTYAVLASQISNVKPNDRDNAFALLTGAVTGAPVSYRDKSSGSFSTGGAVAPSNSGGGSIFGGVFSLAMPAASLIH